MQTPPPFSPLNTLKTSRKSLPKLFVQTVVIGWAVFGVGRLPLGLQTLGYTLFRAGYVHVMHWQCHLHCAAALASGCVAGPPADNSKRWKSATSRALHSASEHVSDLKNHNSPSLAGNFSVPKNQSPPRGTRIPAARKLSNANFDFLWFFFDVAPFRWPLLRSADRKKKQQQQMFHQEKNRNVSLRKKLKGNN